MATHIIPTRQDDNNYELRIDNLDGAIFRLVFRFNQRSGYWYADLLTDDNQRIYSGFKLATAGVPLLRLITNLDRPEGELIVIDAGNQKGEPSLTNLGTDYLLAYEDADTLALAVA